MKLNQPWSTEDDFLLLENIDKTHKQLSKMLDRSESAIGQRVSKHRKEGKIPKVKWKKQHVKEREWSVEETLYLESKLGKMTYPMLSKLLDISEEDIRLKVKELRREKDLVGKIYGNAGGKHIDEVQAYSLEKGKHYKIIDLKTKRKNTLFKGSVWGNYRDYIVFDNGKYLQSFHKSDIADGSIKIEGED